MSSPTLAENAWQRPILGVSFAVCALVGALILAPRPDGFAGLVDTSALPAVNATLNATSAVLLSLGYLAIRARRIRLHRRLMLSAFGVSGAFLVSYVIYHLFSPGPARYLGDHRALYLFVLLTHIVLAAVILPLALTTLTRGLMGLIPQHRRIAPYTLAAWLYVSVTGVVIYAMVHAG